MSQLIRTEDNLGDPCPASSVMCLDPLKNRGKVPHFSCMAETDHAKQICGKPVLCASELIATKGCLSLLYSSDSDPFSSAVGASKDQIQCRSYNRVSVVSRVFHI